MGNFSKSRLLTIIGAIALVLGIVFHAEAESWSVYALPPSVDPTGKAMSIHYDVQDALSSSGLALMILGGIALTLGMISWVYSNRDS